MRAVAAPVGLTLAVAAVACGGSPPEGCYSEAMRVDYQVNHGKDGDPSFGRAVLAEGDGSTEWTVRGGFPGTPSGAGFTIPDRVPLQARVWDGNEDGHPDFMERWEGDVWEHWHGRVTLCDVATKATITIGRWEHWMRDPDSEADLVSWNEFRVVDMDVGHATGSEIQRVVALFDGLFADALKLQAPRPAALEE